jgi:hypothetical protein
MKIALQVTVQGDDGTPTVVHEVFTLARGALAAQVACPACGAARRHKDARKIVVRSLFGVLRLASPRWWHCSCSRQQDLTFSA